MLIGSVEFGLDGGGLDDSNEFGWYVDTIDIAFFYLLLTICHINSCKFFMSINPLLLVLGGLERRRWVQPKRIKGGRHDHG